MLSTVPSVLEFLRDAPAALISAITATAHRGFGGVSL